MLLTPGAHSSNKLVLLGLTAAGVVDVVVKLPRTAVAEAGIAREAAVLAEVRATFGDLPGIPRVLFAGTCAGIRVLAEAALDGVPLSRVAREVDYRAIGLKAAAWQARLMGQGPRARISPRFGGRSIASRASWPVRSPPSPTAP